MTAVAFVGVFVVAVAALMYGAHVLLRPREMIARSATALRELEPNGGRHRFHVRLFEVIALACACVAGLGVLVMFAAAPSSSSTIAMPVVGGGALLVAVWWAWRRGALRAVEAEPPSFETLVENPGDPP